MRDTLGGVVSSNRRSGSSLSEDKNYEEVYSKINHRVANIQKLVVKGTLSTRSKLVPCYMQIIDLFILFLFE